MNLEQLVEAFLGTLQQRNLAPSTMRGAHYAFKVFLEAVDRNLHLAELGYGQIGSYLKHLGLREFSPTTTEQHVRQVRALLLWGAREGHLLRNLNQLFRTPCARLPVAWMPTWDQVAQLLEAPPLTRLGRRDRFVLELLYGTGLRRAEMEALNLFDVQVGEGLWVRGGKGRKDRLQPLGPHLQQLLLNYLDQVRPTLARGSTENALLLTRSGWRLRGWSIYQILKHYGRPLGMPELTLHSLRRAFGSHMLLRSAPLSEVQRLLGHENPETTLRYTQINLGDLQREYRLTHPRALRQTRCATSV